MPRGSSISTYKWLPNCGSIPPALCRVVLQFQPTNGCPTAARYHRLYAAWFFNFNLQMVAQLRLDTTRFILRGSSISTYKWLPTFGPITQRFNLMSLHLYHNKVLP